jgi:nucleoside-diphosphate-sugar epimerase
MMDMDDCLAATYALMTAPRESLTRTTYNVAALSFTPAELAAAIARRVPGFEIEYRPDFRDGIAKTWPASIDDAAARRDWGWAPGRGCIDAVVDAMLDALRPQYEAKGEGGGANGDGKAANNAMGPGATTAAAAARAA